MLNGFIENSVKWKLLNSNFMKLFWQSSSNPTNPGKFRQITVPQSRKRKFREMNFLVISLVEVKPLLSRNFCQKVWDFKVRCVSSKILWILREIKNNQSIHFHDYFAKNYINQSISYLGKLIHRSKVCWSTISKLSLVEVQLKRQ